MNVVPGTALEEHTRVERCPLCRGQELASIHVKPYAGATWSLDRCGGCGLHVTNPRPSPGFLERVYADDYHEDLRNEGGAERAFGAKYRRYLDFLTPHLPPGGRVLDIGCSTGLLVRLLRDRGYRAEGIELNRRSAAWGRDHYGVEIHDGPLESIAFDRGGFDAILLTDVLEHMLDPLEYLGSVRALLREGGLLMVTFPDIRSAEARYTRLIARLAGRPQLWRNCHIPLHIWEFTRTTAEACFRKAGLEIVAFRRAQVQEADPLPWKWRLAWLPIRVLDWSPLARRLGTQMEFLLRKRPDLR